MIVTDPTPPPPYNPPPYEKEDPAKKKKQPSSPRPAPKPIGSKSGRPRSQSLAELAARNAFLEDFTNHLMAREADADADADAEAEDNFWYSYL